MFNLFKKPDFKFLQFHKYYHEDDIYYEIISDDFYIATYSNIDYINPPNFDSQDFNFSSINSFNSSPIIIKNCLAFEERQDFINLNIHDCFFEINSSNIIDVFYELLKKHEEISKNKQYLNNPFLQFKMGFLFSTTYLKKNKKLLNFVQYLFQNYNEQNLLLFAESIVKEDIVSQNQINKLSDLKILPFLISFFLLQPTKNLHLIENKFDLLDINDFFHIDSGNSIFLNFYFKKVIDIHVKYSIPKNYIYNCFKFISFEKSISEVQFIYNFLEKEHPSILDDFFKDVVSQPFSYDAVTNNIKHLEILLFIFKKKPDLIIDFLQNNFKDNWYLNRQIFKIIKINTNNDFIEKHKSYLSQLYPELYSNYSWSDFHTEKKTSEVYSLPFHQIVFSLNIVPVYNEEHIFKKYIYFLKEYFEQQKEKVVINYNLKNNALYTFNYIEKADIVISFNGEDSLIFNKIKNLNMVFFTEDFINQVMLNEPLEYIKKKVREIYLFEKTNERKIFDKKNLEKTKI